MLGKPRDLKQFTNYPEDFEWIKGENGIYAYLTAFEWLNKLKGIDRPGIIPEVQITLDKDGYRVWITGSLMFNNKTFDTVGMALWWVEGQIERMWSDYIRELQYVHFNQRDMQLRELYNVATARVKKDKQFRDEWHEATAGYYAKEQEEKRGEKKEAVGEKQA